MATIEISPGPITALVQNQVYALPARKVTIFSDLALEISNTTDFAVKATVAAVTNVAVAAAYVRSTTSSTAANVCVKVD